MQKLNVFWSPFALVSCLIALWHLVAEYGGLTALVLPSPVDVIVAGWDTRDLLGGAIRATLLETALGLVIATVFGVMMAALMDFWPLARRAVYPLLVASQTVQVLAIAPLLIIWFGFGLTPKVIIVVLICFFPLAVSTADGLASADPDHIDLLLSMGASRWQIWRHVRLPGAMPMFFSGLKVAVTYSVVGATIGEWVGGTEGLGLYMLRSKNALATDQVFAGMVITSLLSIGLFVLVVGIERLALPWYHTAGRKQRWEVQVDTRQNNT